VLRCSLKKQKGGADRVHLAQDRNQQLAVELSYISSVSIKCREFLRQLRNHQLLKKDPAPRAN